MRLERTLSIVLGFCGAATGVLGTGCGTLATEAGDDDAVRPNALAGPFREARPEELASEDAPYVLEDSRQDWRQPTAVVLDPSAGLGETVLYAVGGDDDTSRIHRFTGPDPRRLDPMPAPPEPVLEASLAWEGAFVTAPSAHLIGSEVWLYYAAAGGIGLARSGDGIVFTREPEPVLSRDAAASWEGDAVPQSPSVLPRTDGSFSMFYEAAGRLGEATSSDGIVWSRRPEPVLLPAAGGFDSVGLTDPHALEATTAEGRPVTRLYYAGEGDDGTHAIGLAARFADDRPFERAIAAVFPPALDPRSPAVLPLGRVSLLFVSQRFSNIGTQRRPAVALGIAPANVSIPLD